LVDIPTNPERDVGISDSRHAEPVAAEAGQGMNLISSTFDIIVVDRVNERMHGKPAVDLIGQKCYQEFTKRADVCPGCPGKLALATGETHQAELEGVRDNGTRYTISCTAHPVFGPGGETVGFIEVEEDITEQKRARQVDLVLSQMRRALETISDESGAVHAALNAAVALEGVERGSAYRVNREEQTQTLVSRRGSAHGGADSLPPALPASGEVEIRLPHHPAADAFDCSGSRESINVVVPIVVRGQIVAQMLLGLSGSGEVPAATKIALESIKKEIGDVIEQLGVERWQRRVAWEVESFMTVIPLPVWQVDAQGRVTMWNKMAEAFFGWEADEVVGSPIPLVSTAGEDISELVSPDHLLRAPAECRIHCLSKIGEPIVCVISGVPFEAPVSDASAVAFIAKPEPALEQRSQTGSHAVRPEDGSDREPSSSGSRGIPEENEPDEREADVAGHAPDGPVAQGLNSNPAPVVLVADHDPEARAEVCRVLDGLGCRIVDFPSADEAVAHFRSTVGTQARFDMVIVELLMPHGSDGVAAGRELLKLAPGAKVALASEWPVVGHQQHGFCGAIKKPYARDEIESLLLAVCRHNFARSPGEA